MDNNQLRFNTTQALYGKDLQERSIAIRQLVESDLTSVEIEVVQTRLELALGREDEYVRSAGAMLLDGLADKILISPDMTNHLIALSHSEQAFSREAALRAIKRVCAQGKFFSPRDHQLLRERLEEARKSEKDDFILSLFDEV
jgi:hypothetical protein